LAYDMGKFDSTYNGIHLNADISDLAVLVHKVGVGDVLAQTRATGDHRFSFSRMELERIRKGVEEVASGPVATLQTFSGSKPCRNRMFSMAIHSTLNHIRATRGVGGVDALNNEFIGLPKCVLRLRRIPACDDNQWNDLVGKFRNFIDTCNEVRAVFNEVIENQRDLKRLFNFLSLMESQKEGE
jgi:hypothetical protein